MFTVDIDDYESFACFTVSEAITEIYSYDKNGTISDHNGVIMLVQPKERKTVIKIYNSSYLSGLNLDIGDVEFKHQNNVAQSFFNDVNIGGSIKLGNITQNNSRLDDLLGL